jgi:hypothetical protein
MLAFVEDRSSWGIMYGKRGRNQIKYFDASVSSWNSGTMGDLLGK